MLRLRRHARSGELSPLVRLKWSSQLCLLPFVGVVYGWVLFSFAEARERVVGGWKTQNHGGHAASALRRAGMYVRVS